MKMEVNDENSHGRRGSSHAKHHQVLKTKHEATIGKALGEGGGTLYIKPKRHLKEIQRSPDNNTCSFYTDFEVHVTTAGTTNRLMSTQPAGKNK